MSPPPPGTAISPSTTGRGRSLIATRRFPAGTLIATFSNPLLALPDGPNMRTTCNYCLRVRDHEDTPLRACTGCRAAVYCDASCQRAHWNSGAHKAECKVFARIRAKTGKDWVPTPVRALAQVLLLIEAGEPAMTAAFVGSEALEGNVEGFKSKEKVWADYELQAMAAVVYGGLLKSEELLDQAKEILCKIQTNAFNRHEADHRSAGIFLDANLAMVNHSCIPNAFVGFDKRTAVLRAERDIEVGEEIEISYGDQTGTKSARQQRLELYHFQCQCPRCRDDLDIYEVCSMSPNIDLNKLSLQPDVSRLRHPQVDRSKLSKGDIETIFNQWHFLAPSEGRDAKQVARLRWKLCKPLVEAKMWAVEPLPSSIVELAGICSRNHDIFVYTLPLTCFLTTECDPVDWVAPFLPLRITSMMKLARVLSNVGELRGTGEIKNICKNKRLLEIITTSDQVSMCEAVLRLVLHYGPMGASEDWGLLQEAREILDDIESLEGREQESYFLRTWIKDPEDPEASTFFENVVVKPINDMAALTIDIMNAELGDSQIVARR